MSHVIGHVVRLAAKRKANLRRSSLRNLHMSLTIRHGFERDDYCILSTSYDN